MRKHFLLLMLMALLPLAGWAEDISTANVAVGDIEFGTPTTGDPFVVWKGEELHSPAQYLLQGYYKKVDNAYVSIGDNLSEQPVGTYYLKISGNPDNGFNGDAYGEFKIIKKQLVIDFNEVDKTYGEAYAAPTYTVTYKTGGSEVSEAIKTNLAISILVKDGETPITITNTTGVGSYDFDFTYTEGDYELTRKSEDNDKYVISAKAIDATDMTVEMGDAGTYNYTGNNITGLPTFTVKDGETPVETFDVKWFATEITDATTPADETAVDPKNAGTYYARVSGAGNYGGATWNAAWKITVSPVALNILVNPKEKTYDGVAYKTTDVEYTFGGLVDADQGKINLATLTPKVDGDVWADFKNYKAAGYEISVDATAATIGDPAIELSTNYNVSTVAGKFTINQITGLTITAANQTIAYGVTVPATSTITATGALEAEKEAIEALYVAPDNGGVNTVYGTQANIYIPVLKDASYYGDDTAAKEAAEAVLGNYAAPTIVNGALNIGATGANIMPYIASADYDGQAHAATGYYASSGAYELTADDIDVTNIEYQYKKKNADETWGEYSTTAPTAVGTYRAKVVGATGKGSFAEATITPVEAQFEIKARPITIKVTGATLHKGETEDKLEYTFDQDGTYVSGETIELKPVFVRPIVTGLTLEAETEKVTNDALDNIVGAVTVEAVDGDNDNANYAFTFVAGDLTIAASELVLDPTDVDLAKKIANAEDAGENYAVTFDNLKMNINEWYAMVLPFEIDPLMMVNAANRYVIFNELNTKDTDDQNFKFTLKFEPIPAGTPFLVKFAAKATDLEDTKVDWSTFAAFATPIKADPIDVVTDFVTFKGTYAQFSMQNNKNVADNGADLQDRVWWLCNTDYNGKNTWLKPTNKPHTVAPMEAYLIAAEGWTTYAPNITVEDFDGQTTSIKSISVEQIHNMTVDGLYNMNGVKMQGVPTQKGVYIMNGKKVVIK